MSELIAVKELIRKAQSKGIDLGRGDPYNRLRYYTKIGWLPHMVRKSGDTGVVEGHYPKWVLDRLSLIDKLKESGLSNSEIERRIRSENVRNSLGNIFSFLSSPAKRRQLILNLSFAFIFLILLSELGVISGGTTKQDLLQISNQPLRSAVTIFDSGSALLPASENTIFVKSNTVTAISKINITFTENYSPASRYWVTKVVPFEGFYVALDSPTAQNANFDWWVTN